MEDYFYTIDEEIENKFHVRLFYKQSSCGYINYEIVWSHEFKQKFIRIDLIYVYPRYRQKGIVKNILPQLIEELQLTFERIMLIAQPLKEKFKVKSPPPIMKLVEFYESIGFTYEKKNYPTDDSFHHVIMQIKNKNYDDNSN